MLLRLLQIHREQAKAMGIGVRKVSREGCNCSMVGFGPRIYGKSVEIMFLTELSLMINGLTKKVQYLGQDTVD
jgi:hypothetical protein